MSTLDEFRAEFDRLQGEIHEADTEARRLQSLPTSRGDTLQMIENVINDEAKRCRAPVGQFLLEVSRNVTLRRSGLRGLVHSRLNAAVPGRHPSLDDLTTFFVGTLGAEPLIAMVRDAANEIEWPETPDGPEREKQIAAAVQRRDRAKALAGDLVDQARQAGFVFP